MTEDKIFDEVMLALKAATPEEVTNLSSTLYSYSMTVRYSMSQELMEERLTAVRMALQVILVPRGRITM